MVAPLKMGAGGWELGGGQPRFFIVSGHRLRLAVVLIDSFTASLFLTVLVLNDFVNNYLGNVVMKR
jgi:hypothetical protein